MFLGTTVEDIERAHATGRIAVVASIEGAAPIENELDRIDVLYGLGVRMLGVTYSETNQLGGGVRDPGDGGLTAFGRGRSRRMNRLGMAIDVSHSGDTTAMQTCDALDRAGVPVALGRAGALRGTQAQGGRPASRGRRHRRSHRHRGLAEHDDAARPARTPSRR